MRAISKIFNIISSIIIAILLAFLAYATIFTYNFGGIVSERQNLKDWLTDPVVKEAYVDYIIDGYYSTIATPLSGFVEEKDVKKLMGEQLTGQAFDDVVDSTVNTIYDWLEGRSDSIHIETSTDTVIEDLEFINEMYDDDLGILSDIIDPTDILKLSDSLNIIDLDQLTANNFPYLYQLLLSLPKKLLIVCIVLSVLLLLSNRSWRYGIFMMGLSLTILPLYTLFAYKFLPLDSVIDFNSILEKMDISSLDQIPRFLVLVYEKASIQIMSATNKHALIMLIVGILLVVISQLAIKEKESDENDIKTAL